MASRGDGPSAASRAMIDRLIAFDTTSRNSNLALIDFVRGYLDGHGMTSHLTHSEDGGKANLYATIGPEDQAGGVVLSGHTDVVPVDGQAWDNDPFTVSERGDRLYGRGTADMKSFIAVALALVPEMAAARLCTPVHLALSFDEEVGCLGVRHMIGQIREALPLPELVIVGEPTDMKVVSAQKGIHGFTTEVNGFETHSSATHIGVNAVQAAARLIVFLEDLAAELAAQPPQGPLDAEFDPPYTTISVGTIEGGTALNIVPLRCRFGWECRPLPGVDAQEVVNRLEAFAREALLPDMQARHPEADIVTTPGASVPGLIPEADSPAEALVRLLTGSNKPGAASFASEAGLFQQAGIPAVLCGPGSIAQAHQPNEFITLMQIAACEDFMRRLIAHLS